MVFLFVVFCLQSGTWYGSVEFLEWSCVEGEDFLLLLIFLSITTTIHFYCYLHMYIEFSLIFTSFLGS